MGAPDPTTYAAQPIQAPPQLMESNKRKRKSTRTTITEGSPDDEVIFLGKNAKGTAMSKSLSDEYELGEGNPQKVKKTKKSLRNTDEEKRLRKWRAKPPRSFTAIKERALTQRMFVIARTRGGTEDIPEEAVDIAGTTGNIYTVTINKTPGCTCPYAEKGHQCKHIVYVLSRVLRAPEQLAYQLAFISSELRQIFAKAPPIPSADSSDASSDGNRKPIEDDCPICCMEFEEGKEQIVYCKAACGNNIHMHCFEKWAAAKNGSGAVTCPFCRTPWAGDEDMIKKIAKGGTVNSEGYVNVAGQLGITGERDYSSYNGFWVRRQVREGNIDRSHWFDDY